MSSPSPKTTKLSSTTWWSSSPTWWSSSSPTCSLVRCRATPSGCLGAPWGSQDNIQNNFFISFLELKSYFFLYNFLSLMKDMVSFLFWNEKLAFTSKLLFLFSIGFLHFFGCSKSIQISLYFFKIAVRSQIIYGHIFPHHLVSFLPTSPLLPWKKCTTGLKITVSSPLNV